MIVNDNDYVSIMLFFSNNDFVTINIPRVRIMEFQTAFKNGELFEIKHKQGFSIYDLSKIVYIRVL